MPGREPQIGPRTGPPRLPAREPALAPICGSCRRRVAAEGAPGACDPLVFLPDNLAAGIEPLPGDRILPARSPAYAVSLARRTE